MAEKAKPKSKKKAPAKTAPVKRPPRVVLFEGEDGWRIRLEGGNGEPMQTSEAYFSKGNARRAAKKLKKVFPGLEMFEERHGALIDMTR